MKTLLITCLILTFIIPAQDTPSASQYILHKVPVTSNLQLYYKNTDGKPYKSIGSLKYQLSKKGDSLVFAMNAGMFTQEGTPLGLYIENGKVITPLNTVKKAYGNFYLQPNGVFYLTKDGTSHICKTTEFKLTDQIHFATQSGPMLLINGAVHPKFNKDSENKNIRNGVGILPDGSMLFVMSKEPVNLYSFAILFKQHGCQNALYLDGYVSQTYLPSENWIQTGGPFGVIIGETIKK